MTTSVAYQLSFLMHLVNWRDCWSTSHWETASVFLRQQYLLGISTTAAVLHLNNTILSTQHNCPTWWMPTHRKFRKFHNFLHVNSGSAAKFTCGLNFAIVLPDAVFFTLQHNTKLNCTGSGTWWSNWTITAAQISNISYHTQQFRSPSFTNLHSNISYRDILLCNISL